MVGKVLCERREEPLLLDRAVCGPRTAAIRRASWAMVVYVRSRCAAGFPDEIDDQVVFAGQFVDRGNGLAAAVLTHG